MTTSRTWLAAAVVAATLTLLPACAGEEAPPPPTSTTTTTETSTSTTPRLAPQVQDPLEIDGFAKDPCTSLTPAQVADLGLKAGHIGDPEEAGQVHDSCAYPGSDPAAKLAVTVNYFPDTNGLDYRYEEHEDGSWPQWHPTEVGGYPAVIFSSKDPTPNPHECDLDVGVSDTSFFYVRAAYFAQVDHGWEETCAMTKDIAAAVLATVKAAA